MQIFLVRHGETSWNVEGRLQGQIDEIQLTSKGMSQAEEISKKLQQINFDVIFSSPFVRTLQTTNIINKSKKKEIVLCDNLKERGYGELEGEYAKDGNYNIKQMWDIDNIYDMHGVERVDFFIKRIHRFIDNLIKENKYNKVLLVSHSGVSIAAKTYFQGIPDDRDLLKLGIGNCEVVTFESEKEQTLTSEEFEI